jgi:DNA-binding MarR family transcriptional regulator
MFGALTYIPLFQQVVRGVSPTMSGVGLLPMVVGMLTSSITSGQIISRTGRYRIFPITGTLLMATALYLLSTMGPQTAAWTTSLYFLVLGLGLGLVMQVLVIVVQSTVGYEDLGVGTSGVTFFRSIGGSFGVAVFGSIFSSRLAQNLSARLRGVSLPPGLDPAGVLRDPAAVRRLPAGAREAILRAYSDAITTVFLWAVPVALIGFVLALLLKEAPLRGVAQAADLGECLGGAPTARSSIAEVERALSALLRRDSDARQIYAQIGRLAGVDLPPGSLWALCRIAREERMRAADLAERADVSMPEGRPYVDRLIMEGLVEREDDGMLVITRKGRELAARLVEARRQALCGYMEGWDSDAHPELSALLTTLAHSSLDQERLEPARQ